MAVMAHSPKLALPAAQLSAAVVLDSAWGQRANLRELAFQTVALHFGDRFSAEARKSNTVAAGLSPEQLASLPDWRDSDLFDSEQRLVIEYTQAVVTGRVPDDLFARIVARYGEQEAVECTAAIAFWSFWAMISGAAGL
jgi:alkylhydroperoxidase family enzyme